MQRVAAGGLRACQHQVRQAPVLQQSPQRKKVAPPFAFMQSALVGEGPESSRVVSGPFMEGAALDTQGPGHRAAQRRARAGQSRLGGRARRAGAPQRGARAGADGADRRARHAVRPSLLCPCPSMCLLGWKARGSCQQHPCSAMFSAQKLHAPALTGTELQDRGNPAFDYLVSGRGLASAQWACVIVPFGTASLLLAACVSCMKCSV